jgi:hypothetical protein
MAVGKPAASTDTRFLLTPACYREVRTIVQSYAGATGMSAVFAVSSEGQKTVQLPAPGMRAVLAALRRMYEQEGATPPAMLAIQEHLLQTLPR